MLDVIILAGGFGTRLKEIVSDVPKPLAPINGKPFLDILLNQLQAIERKNIILSVGYQKEKIKEVYRESSFVFSEEEVPLGTGGAIRHAMRFAKGRDVLILNGDSFFGVDLSDLVASHAKNQADLTIACKKMEDVSRYGSITFDEKNSIKGFYEKLVSSGPGWINGGIYLMKKELLSTFPNTFSLEKDAFPILLNNRVFAYPSFAKFIDIGTKESYLEAGKFFT